MGIEECYLFAQIQGEDLAALERITLLREYPAGTVLFYAGETPQKLLLIHRGKVRVIKHDSVGNEIVLADFKANELVAEMAHFEGIVYPATARCETDVVVYEIDFKAFKTGLLNRPELALQIIRSLTQKIKQLESVISQTLIDDARTRLARYLLKNIDTLADTTQKQIAARIMLTPETVSRILRQFKDEGWVEVRSRKIVVTDPEGLGKVLDEE